MNLQELYNEVSATMQNVDGVIDPKTVEVFFEPSLGANSTPIKYVDLRPAIEFVDPAHKFHDEELEQDGVELYLGFDES